MRRVLAICAVLMACGCATIFAKDSKTISFDTTDAVGQSVAVDGVTYKLPCQVSLGTDVAHRATFPNGQTVTIRRTFNGWFIANLLLGGIVGMAIDLISGDVNANLSPTRLSYRGGSIYFGEKEVGPDGKPKTREQKPNKAEPRYGP